MKIIEPSRLGGIIPYAWQFSVVRTYYVEKPGKHQNAVGIVRKHTIVDATREPEYLIFIGDPDKVIDHTKAVVFTDSEMLEFFEAYMLVRNEYEELKNGK